MAATLANLLSNNHGLRVLCDARKRLAEVDVEQLAILCGTAIILPEIGHSLKRAGLANVEVIDVKTEATKLQGLYSYSNLQVGL